MAKNNGYKRIKDDTHELIYTTETYRLPKQTYGYQRGIIGGRINYEVGIWRVGGRCKTEGIWGYMYMYSWFTLLYSRN